MTAKSPARTVRFLTTAAAVAYAVLAAGCGSFSYEYVLDVRCDGRHVVDPRGGGYNYTEGVSDSPPVEVTIWCDGFTTTVNYNPAGETQTIRFGEFPPRLMIDGDAYARGFKVRARRPGYKDWVATYHSDRLWRTGGGSFLRLDSVELELTDDPYPSARISGGPEQAGRVPPP